MVCRAKDIHYWLVAEKVCWSLTAVGAYYLPAMYQISHTHTRMYTYTALDLILMTVLLEEFYYWTYRWGSEWFSNWPKVTQLGSKYQSWDLNLCQSNDKACAIISTLDAPAPKNPFLLDIWLRPTFATERTNWPTWRPTSPEGDGARFEKKASPQGI